jgi:hypothetical protein
MAVAIRLHMLLSEAEMRDGEVNRQFGIYVNNCCSAEIVIPEGVTFPQCSKHLRTEWKDITDVDSIPRESEVGFKGGTAEHRLSPMGELAELLYQNMPSR